MGPSFYTYVLLQGCVGLLLDSAQVLNRFSRYHTATIRLFSPGMQGLLEGTTESLVNRPYASVGGVCGTNMLCPDLALR